MAALATPAQMERRELDLRLNEQLEGTFPASDPPKITHRFARSRDLSDRQRKISPAPKSERPLKQAAAERPLKESAAVRDAPRNHLDERTLCRGPWHGGL
jgi:hypothetical protein